MCEARYNPRVSHSGYTQQHRDSVMKAFVDTNEPRILISCDGIRGMDFVKCDVYSLDAPSYLNDFVHRIGRSGRAGALGRSLSLVWPGDKKFLKYLKKHLGESHKPCPRWFEGGEQDAMTMHDALGYLEEVENRWLGRQ